MAVEATTVETRLECAYLALPREDRETQLGVNACLGCLLPECLSSLNDGGECLPDETEEGDNCQ